MGLLRRKSALRNDDEGLFPHPFLLGLALKRELLFLFLSYPFCIGQVLSWGPIFPKFGVEIIP
jgi:hypothetical protein